MPMMNSPTQPKIWTWPWAWITGVHQDSPVTSEPRNPAIVSATRPSVAPPVRVARMAAFRNGGGGGAGRRGAAARGRRRARGRPRRDRVLQLTEEPLGIHLVRRCEEAEGLDRPLRSPATGQAVSLEDADGPGPARDHVAHRHVGASAARG